MAYARMRDLTAEYNQYMDAVKLAWADRERADAAKKARR